MKTIISCISKLVVKNKLKIPIIFKMRKSEFIVKIRSKTFKKDTLENTFDKFCKSFLPFKLKNKDTKSDHKIFLKFDDSQRYLKYYNIKDPFMIKNIKSLEKITAIHISNYSTKNMKYISSVKDVIYIVIGFHQYNIKSLEDYRRMKPEEVVTKEVLDRIKYL
ncbi:hypothetical protein [Cetobacterium sp.]|uniref:hypothetical protein n=1 Tax=Cetobacterium sp. TaxID=2071632 RepID=UPI003F30217F